MKAMKKLLVIVALVFAQHQSYANECFDEDIMCLEWAREGRCVDDEYVIKRCHLSCSKRPECPNSPCEDYKSSCDYYAKTLGDCNHESVNSLCQKSCNILCKEDSAGTHPSPSAPAVTKHQKQATTKPDDWVIVTTPKSSTQSKIRTTESTTVTKRNHVTPTRPITTKVPTTQVIAERHATLKSKQKPVTKQPIKSAVPSKEPIKTQEWYYTVIVQLPKSWREKYFRGK